jgi:hypothetical protein
MRQDDDAGLGRHACREPLWVNVEVVWERCLKFVLDNLT